MKGMKYFLIGLGYEAFYNIACQKLDKIACKLALDASDNFKFCIKSLDEFPRKEQIKDLILISKFSESYYFAKSDFYYGISLTEQNLDSASGNKFGVALGHFQRSFVTLHLIVGEKKKLSTFTENQQ